MINFEIFLNIVPIKIVYVQDKPINSPQQINFRNGIKAINTVKLIICNILVFFVRQGVGERTELDYDNVDKTMKYNFILLDNSSVGDGNQLIFSTSLSLASCEVVILLLLHFLLSVTILIFDIC